MLLEEMKVLQAQLEEEGRAKGSASPSLWSDSSFSSVVDSPASSSEGSEEDDEFMAGLAEQMAHSMLEDSDDNNVSASKEVEGTDWGGLWGDCWSPASRKAASPQETGDSKTRWSTGYWSGYSSSSSKVSSQVSSPRSGGGVDDGWDLLHTVAGEVNRLNADEKPVSAGWRGQAAHHLSEVQWKHALHESPLGRGGPIAGSLPILTKPYGAAAMGGAHRAWNHSTTTVEEDNAATASQSRVSKQYTAGAWNRQGRCLLTQQQQLHQQQPPPPRSVYKAGLAQRPIVQQQQQHWPALAPPPTTAQHGSTMRAVFLGGTSDRSSCGTGVFLPRSSSDYATKRKTSCSSVLLPSRIVQVLNLNIEDVRCQPSPPGTGPPMPPAGFEAAGRSSSADQSTASSQWKTYTTCSQLHQPSESTLPTEWSY